MKVTMISDYYYMSGAAYHVAYLSNALLRSNNVNISLITKELPELTSREHELAKEEKFFNKFESRVYVEKLNVRAPVSSIIAMRSHIMNADLVHVHASLSFRDLAYLATDAPMIEQPLITTIHTSMSYRTEPVELSTTKELLQRLISRSSYVIAVGRGVENVLATNYDCEGKVRFIPNGVDQTLFCPRAKRTLREKYSLPTGFLVLFVGRLINEKGLDVLCEAINSKKIDSSVNFLIVGDGPYASKISAFPNVRYAPFISRQKLAELYSAADVYLLPSRTEGMPLTILEAMASGLPTITTNISGNNELIDSTKGYLVEVGSVKDLVGVINRATREDLTIKAGNALEFSKKYSWTAVADKTLALYRRAVR